MFVGLCLSSCLWLGLEIHRPLGPEWLLAARDALRLAFEALWTAGFQVWAARLLILWRRPETETSDGEAARAWRDLQGRWRQIIALTAFNAAWMSLRLWIHLERLPWVELIILEMLLVFSPLPLFIALNSAETAFRTSGGQTLSLLGRALPSLLGLLVTAIALMALLLQTQVSLRPMLVAAGLPPTAAALPFAFMLAIARNWLFVAAGLTFMAHLPGAPTTD